MPINGAGGDHEFDSLGLVLARLEHELRSPLQAVSGFARLLRDRVPEDQRRLAEYLCTAIDQMTAVVDQLARPGTHRGDGDTDTDESMESSLRRALAVVTAQAEAAQVTVVVEGGRWDLAVPAALTLGRLTEVMVNLLTNAVKHGPPQSTVRIGAQSTADAWTMTVSDEGPGVPAGMEERIFEPFAKVGTRAGTGLGLFIVRDLVQRAGGTVHLDQSGDAPGATFRVVVPLDSRAT